MYLLVLLFRELPRLNQLCSSHTLKLLMGARGHLEDLTQHLTLLLALDLHLPDIEKKFSEPKIEWNSVK